MLGANGESLELNQNGQNLEFIEDRLNELRTEARKHNCKVDDLIKVRNKLKVSLDQIKGNNYKIDELKIKYADAKKQFISASTLLSESRKKSSIILTKKINDELPQLKLENASLSINMDKILIEAGFKVLNLSGGVLSWKGDLTKK